MPVVVKEVDPLPLGGYPWSALSNESICITGEDSRTERSSTVLVSEDIVTLDVNVPVVGSVRERVASVVGTVDVGGDVNVVTSGED